ncbi:hypothetical protein FGG78_31225 [Thioclava sp. BHET1]|nr:hypothetical protein FGG78_31225 [Thioclava sp. BHET1]
MPIYEFASEEIRPFNKTTFSLAQLQERRDLQRLLRTNIVVVAPDALDCPIPGGSSERYNGGPSGDCLQQLSSYRSVMTTTAPGRADAG